MTLTEDEWAILDGNSDDWYGLWEVNWWFNAVHPDWPSEQRCGYLTDLIRMGLLEVFADRVEEAVLSQDAAIEALRAPTNWLPPTVEDHESYYVSTTKAGVAALQTQGS